MYVAVEVDGIVNKDEEDGEKGVEECTRMSPRGRRSGAEPKKDRRSSRDDIRGSLVGLQDDVDKENRRRLVGRRESVFEHGALQS